MTDKNSFDDIHNVKFLQFHYHHLRIETVLYVAYENAELQQVYSGKVIMTSKIYMSLVVEKWKKYERKIDSSPDFFHFLESSSIYLFTENEGKSIITMG